jgi:hypothetical protein
VFIAVLESGKSLRDFFRYFGKLHVSEFHTEKNRANLDQTVFERTFIHSPKADSSFSPFYSLFLKGE